MGLKTSFICEECGYSSPKWYGKCPSCTSWNTMVEKQQEKEPGGRLHSRSKAAPVKPFSIGSISITDEIRYKTGIKELDRVFGGGIVKGSVTLVGGDPGIGKSTILLQVCGALCERVKVLYISGEESAAQIKLRSNRLGINSENLFILSETDIDSIVATVENEKPKILIVDSIQTVHSGQISSIPGSISQIKECALALIELSKRREITTFLVGHVNKDGAIAGPKVLEHMVDTVLYFEGEKELNYRLLRAAKNRYGSTNEIGLFEMCGSGLSEVANPSEMLLAGKPRGVSGSCAICAMEGTRPILAEIQALVSKTFYPVAKRTATGIDQYRVAMLLAVLEKRLLMNLCTSDVYVNVVGGFRVTEPSCDAAAAVAIASSHLDKPVDDRVIVIGEVGLAGELRAVKAVEQRITEAVRMGFEKILIPYHNKITFTTDKAEIIALKNIGEAINIALN